MDGGTSQQNGQILPDIAGYIPRTQFVPSPVYTADGLRTALPPFARRHSIFWLVSYRLD